MFYWLKKESYKLSWNTKKLRLIILKIFTHFRLFEFCKQAHKQDSSKSMLFQTLNNSTIQVSTIYNTCFTKSTKVQSFQWHLRFDLVHSLSWPRSGRCSWFFPFSSRRQLLFIKFRFLSIINKSHSPFSTLPYVWGGKQTRNIKRIRGNMRMAKI